MTGRITRMIVVGITLLRAEILQKPIGFLFTKIPSIENAGAMQQWDIYIVAESEQSPPLLTISISSNAMSINTRPAQESERKKENINRSPILQKAATALTHSLARMSLRARRSAVGAVLPRRTRWPAIRAVLPRRARPPLRTWRPAPALLSGTTGRAPVVVARPPVSRNTAPHAFAPRARAEGVHHHAGLADGATCSASADGSIAGQPRAAGRRDGVLEGRGEVPFWLDVSLRGCGSVRGRRRVWRVGM